MKRTLILQLFLLLTFSLVWAQDKKENKSPDDKSSAVDTTRVNWYRYDDGLARAKEADKHVFVYFATSWCKFCRKMDQEIFTRPDVIKVLNEQFIPIRVDGESKQELNINGYKITEQNLTVAEYAVRGYPTMWFLKPGGDRLGSLSGYKDSESLLEVLYFLKDRLYDKMTFDDYIKGGGRKAHNKG
jgi:thioredoxin-related protein